MAPVPVVCDACGAFFVAENLIGGSGMATVTFENVGYEPCPVCGGTGRVLDGTYEFVGDTVRMLTGADWSRKRLVRLAALLHDLGHGAVPGDLRPENVLVGDPSQAIYRLEQEEPSLAAQLKPKSSADLAAWLTLLLMIAQTLLGLGSDKSMSEKDIQKVIRAVMDQAQHSVQTAPARAGGRPPPPPPRKRHQAAKKKRRR